MGQVEPAPSERGPSAGRPRGRGAGEERRRRRCAVRPGGGRFARAAGRGHRFDPNGRRSRGVVPTGGAGVTGEASFQPEQGRKRGVGFHRRARLERGRRIDRRPRDVVRLWWARCAALCAWLRDGRATPVRWGLCTILQSASAPRQAPMKPRERSTRSAARGCAVRTWASRILARRRPVSYALDVFRPML